MSGTEESKDSGEGWIEWGGGECPVEGDVRVDVMLPDGMTFDDCRAGFWEGDGGAQDSNWRHFGHRSTVNIIAYRIHKES